MLTGLNLYRIEFTAFFAQPRRDLNGELTPKNEPGE